MKSGLYMKNNEVIEYIRDSGAFNITTGEVVAPSSVNDADLFEHYEDAA